ncbi:unnamed protein product [Parnassius apollo]|uniref:(apollo) hypothetical protein n=1 Tax=Parnassius apollo TaxID=110799 RepID=A0A8S3WXW9_PARAO|nr:unnamed protein product [Parnassius apollo]
METQRKRILNEEYNDGTIEISGQHATTSGMLKYTVLFKTTNWGENHKNMPGSFWKYVTCVKMEYNVEEGRLPREFIEYDFAEDAMDYETQLAEARDIKFTQTLTEPLCIGSHIICTGTPTENVPW